MTDALTSKAIRKLNEAQRIADEQLLGNERYSELTLWQDGDFHIEVFHGFQCSREPDIHHGERIRYKYSDGNYIYEITKRLEGSLGTEILKSKVVN